MPHHAKTHEENRSKICLLCFNKGKVMRLLTKDHYETIENYIIDGFDRSDNRLPNGICGTCRLTVQECSQGNFKRLQHLNVYDHSLVVGSQPPLTRSAATNMSLAPSQCPCVVCGIARSKSTNLGGTAGIEKQPRGRPSSSNAFATEKPKAITICSKCLTQLRKGVSHVCTATSRADNIQSFVATSPTTATKDHVAAAILKEKESDSGTSNFKLSHVTGGRPSSVEMNPSQESKLKQPVFTHEIMSDMQNSLNLSDRKVLKVSKTMREATGRKAIEPHLKSMLQNKSHMFDAYFDVKYIDFVKIEKNTVVDQCGRWTLLCNNVNALIDKIVELRGYGCYDVADDDILIRVGIDGGGGFFKVCLSIFPLQQQRSAAGFKDSGVKRVFLLAIAPSIQENYHNLQKIWVSLGMNSLQRKYVIATDLKLSNMLLGLMAHGALHPCCWCEIDKNNLHEKGTARTMENLQQHFWDYMESGRNATKAKEYFNVAHPSLLHVNDVKTTVSVLEWIPPPELHLLMGPTNAIYKGLADIWPDVNLWLKACHVEREEIHGGSFCGNSCKILLSKTDLLASLAPLHVLPYVAAFRSFSKVSAYQLHHFSKYSSDNNLLH